VSKPRVALLVLVLIAVLFVVALGMGLFQDDGRPELTPAALRDYQAPSWTKVFGSLLEPMSPRLRLQPSTINIGARGVTITVPPANDAFRKATFRRRGPSPVHIVYDSGGEAPKGLGRQEWPQAGDSEDIGTLIVLKGGGRLTFTCPGLSPCSVVLE
jgi:hypothetical protein